MNYFAFLLYLTLGIAATGWCARYSRRRGVESTFSKAGLAGFFDSVSPIAIIIVIPFSVVFWPLLCLMDLSEIPKKRRLKQKQLEANAMADEQDIVQENRQRQAALHQLFVGEICEAISPLKPMGKVRVNGQTWDATSTGGYIATGQQVVVTGVRGQTLEVSGAFDRS